MIFTADPVCHAPQIREIYWEYLQWVNGRIFQEYGVDFDIAAILERDMLDLDKFMPPKGRLFLCYPEEKPGGMGCLKPLSEGCGEIKRMYVRPEYRGKGLGRALLEAILRGALQIGYERIRLDSANFMTEAHQLYRSAGFVDIEPYEGSEIPPDYHKNWVFMEKRMA